MNRIKALAVALAAVVSTWAFGVTLENTFEYSKADTIKVAEWNMHFNAMKEKADAENIPLVIFWANPGCGKCNMLEKALSPTNTPVTAWMKKRGYLFCFGYGTSTKDESACKSFVKHSSGEFPYCGIYWKEEGMTKDPAPIKFVGRDGSMPVKKGTLAEQFMASCEKYLSEYVNYLGGSFNINESEGHRLEADPTMTELSLPITRDENAVPDAQEETVTFLGPDGEKIEDYPLSWSAGEATKTLVITIPAGTFAGKGEKATLVLSDAEGTEIESVTITGVNPETSAYNPLWLGERVAGGVARGGEPLQFGEWTMDLEVAKATAAAAEGEAYTLALVEGSLWCPDCQAVEKYFLSLKDEKTGENRFDAWAKAHQVALAAIDVPRFTTNTVASTYPTLLSREPRTSNLGEKSGLGYQTRKGITAEAAAEVLERNRRLVSDDVAKDGFHVGTDASEFRTGVPCFVLLRKDGTVAARLTRWWTVAPKETETAKWNDFIKRFDEMLAIAAEKGEHADPTEVANNAPAGAASFAANGGEAAGELSHVDLTDVFKLDGVGGNALQKVTVKGKTTAEVTVALGSADEAGKFVALKSVTGKLNAGISLEHTFTTAGDYYVRVEAKDVTAPAFAIDSTTADNFHPYTISGDVVLVPQQDKATGAAPADSNEVVLRLVKDAKYRLDGLATESLPAGVLEGPGGTNLYFTALASGDATLPLAGGPGASLDYQLWVPGSVGFVASAKTVSEKVGSVTVPFERVGGKSGDVTVSIAVDQAATDLYDYWGEPRFEFEDMKFTWRDGELSSTNLVVGIKNDKYFDGTGKLVLNLTILSDENGDTELTKGVYTLTVTDDEKQNPGRAAVVAAEPYFAKKLTVYARESESAVVSLGRIENFDGAVTIAVEASDRTVTLAAGAGNKGYETVQTYAGLQTWANRDSADKELVISNLPAAGKTVKVALTALTGSTFKANSSASSVTIVSVADAAPGFETAADELAIARYVTVEAAYQLLSTPDDPKKVTFTKLTGTLPAGLKVGYDANANALAITGATTAKAGVYTVVYQVKFGALAGMTKELTITITDPTDAKGAPETANASVASSRTFKDLPVVCPGHGLIGTLQVTIPTKGNVSAKYLSEQGTIPFSTKAWSAFDAGSKELTATLTSTKPGYTMTVIAKDAGDVDVTIVDPTHDSEDLTVTTDGTIWSAKKPATAWKGYYTAALVGTDQIETVAGVAPRGYGYLTLKLDSVSALNSGKVTWAGALPNGTAISGSSIISVDEENRALVPIFKASSSDVFGILPTIEPGAEKAEPGTSHTEIKPQDGVKTFWKHLTKNSEDATFECDFKIYGGYYDPSGSLEACCEEQHGSRELTLSFNTDDLEGWTAAGKPGAVTPTMITVGESSIKLEDGAPAGMSISLAKATGLVSGKVTIPVGERGRASASWKGVVVTGWGEGCGCGETVITLPFIVGAYVVSDSVVDSKTGRSVSLKRGGKVEAANSQPE